MEFVRNLWYVALWSQDLAAGKMISRTLLNEDVLLFRDENGVVSALEDRCPHRSAPLHLGKIVDGHHIRCAYHGLEFNGHGQCVHNPHTPGKIPAAAKVRSYPVAEKHSLIWIWMGDRPANPSRIPSFELLDGGHEVSKRDYLLMQANYSLIVDNLMDLSHTAFLHDGILGSEETILAEQSVAQVGDQVTVKRHMPDVPVPGLFDLMYKRNGRNVDFWADIRWDAPGCLLNDTGVTAVGAPHGEGTGIYGMHFVTPETASTSHYHFAAVRQNPIVWEEPIATEIREKISDLRRYAFEFQDKIVIEGQQKVINRLGHTPGFVLLATDGGTVRYRKILDAMLAAEKS